jgi:hypothetical protein
MLYKSSVFISREYGYVECKYISLVHSFVVGILNTTQSRFDKGQESLRQYIGCGEIADGKSITHLYMYITDKKQSECRS